MEPISADMAEPMRPAIRMAIITGANSLHMERPIMPPNDRTDAALHQNRAGLQGQHAADEKGKDADHEEAAMPM